MGYLVMIGQLLLSLSFLIILHELGHFLPAKYFGTRVEKFYLFFDPWFELFKFKKGETEYGIGWLPLGGYVKIAGMVDESMDLEQLKQPAQPWEFRSKPAWQRLIIMLGGVTVNFILGFLIWGLLLWNYGESKVDPTTLKYGIHVDCLGEYIGLEDGDIILKVGEVPMTDFNPGIIRKEIAINDSRTITVRKPNGQQKVLTLSEEQVAPLMKKSTASLSIFGPRMPNIVDTVIVDDPAFKAGMKKRDRIIGINGSPIEYFHEISSLIDSAAMTKIQVLRGTDTLMLTATSTEKSRIGVGPVAAKEIAKVEDITYTLGEALPLGVKKGIDFLGVQVKAFAQMFRGRIKATESLGGFGTITSLFPTTWQWYSFWRITAILSLILAFMNLLPIPALDGGHVMFLLYEMISGRPPNDKFLEYATIAGFIILIVLMVGVNGMELFQWLFPTEIDPCDFSS